MLCGREERDRGERGPYSRAPLSVGPSPRCQDGRERRQESYHRGTTGTAENRDADPRLPQSSQSVPGGKRARISKQRAVSRQQPTTATRWSDGGKLAGGQGLESRGGGGRTPRVCAPHTRRPGGVWRAGEAAGEARKATENPLDQRRGGREPEFPLNGVAIAATVVREGERERVFRQRRLGA